MEIEYKDRKPSVSGRFYSSDKVSLESELQALFKQVDSLDSVKNIRALLVPHAGYIYSGAVAAAGYSKIDPENSFDRIFLIGSSHQSHFEGASIYAAGNYLTPFGSVEVDLTLAHHLIENHSFFNFVPEAHKHEHSLEVQLPFLQFHLKNAFKIIPIVIGSQERGISREIAQALGSFFKAENLFVISTDLSHYPAYDEALKADRRVLDAVLTGAPDALMKAIEENKKDNVPNLLTSMCAWPAVMTLLELTQGSDQFSYKEIQYNNSGDSVFGEKSRVVGYGSIVVIEKNPEQGFLSESIQATLLQLSRTALHNASHGLESFQDVNPDIDGFLSKPAGLFVSLHNKNGDLRACIGQLKSDKSLSQLIQEVTISAALRDYRFTPVKPEELDELEIEISVLTPMQEISSIDKIELGRHGIYISKGGQSGTFLPQVAITTGWDLEHFLGHCSKDKAGLGWDGWKDAKIFTFEAIVFSGKAVE